MSTTLGTSLTQTLRIAETVIQRHRQAAQAPAVLWAGLDESEEAFALRCAALQNAGAHRILAAVPYEFRVPAGVKAVEFPTKHFRLLHPGYYSRYRSCSGGRGSAKSRSFSMAIILRMLEQRMRVLCAREIQRSLRESVHRLLTDTIDKLGLASFFEVTDREIACPLSGSEVIFAGLFSNVQSLKSLEGVNLCWVEEGESVSARSFEILTPTVRDPGSEIWISLNPDAVDAPVMAYVNTDRPDVTHLHVDYRDNPYFPATLEGERLQCERTDPDLYAHIWLGQPRTFSNAQVFARKYEIADFTPAPSWSGPWFGADWGFAEDPSALVKCWALGNVLYIEAEAFGHRVDINRLPNLFDEVPGARVHTIRADCSRPETISYMRQHGYANVVPCEKWKGSVEDGVAFLRSFDKIVLHPSCTHLAEEFRLYSFKVDKLSGDILPDLVDRWNHGIDALRYALQPLIQRRRHSVTISDPGFSFMSR